jgi:hypothetical protein
VPSPTTLINTPMGRCSPTGPTGTSPTTSMPARPKTA